MSHIPPQAYRIARELADMGNLRIPLSANDLAYAAQLLCTQFDQIEKLKAAQERKPLTATQVGEIYAAWKSSGAGAQELVRAVEAAQGIKEAGNAR